MIKPLNKRILIKLHEIKETDSGIVLSSNKDIIVEEAEVLEVADDVTKAVKGDRIFYKSWALDTVRVKDKEYNFIDEKEILAKKSTKK